MPTQKAGCNLAVGGWQIGVVSNPALASTANKFQNTALSVLITGNENNARLLHLSMWRFVRSASATVPRGCRAWNLMNLNGNWPAGEFNYTLQRADTDTVQAFTWQTFLLTLYGISRHAWISRIFKYRSCREFVIANLLGFNLLTRGLKTFSQSVPSCNVAGSFYKQ